MTALDTGNTAWLTMSAILVMLMTVPGLAFFYGGLVRSKNILSIVMQCLMCTAVISILWVAFGYSWVFGTGFQGTGIGAVIGGFDKLFLHGVTIKFNQCILAICLLYSNRTKIQFQDKYRIAKINSKISDTIICIHIFSYGTQSSECNDNGVF